MEETSSDPIPPSIFNFMCESAVTAGDAFWWLFSLLQWECIGRCQNIDDLKHQNFKVEGDSVVVTFDRTKKDQSGAKCSPKHCYANPMDMNRCLFTAIAVYFCMHNLEWNGNQEYVFIKVGASPGSAAQNYSERIKTWVKRNADRLIGYVRPSHVNTHSLRKGSATHSSSGTTDPPPLPSIFRRGEWSMGVILDIYWQWAASGDQYLGRILAGLNPESPGFNSLPPHFKVPFDDPRVEEGMRICFGNLLNVVADDETSFLPALLQLCLASLVHHADKLQVLVCTTASHPFANIPILKDPELLERLKSIVTTEKTPGIMEDSTGRNLLSDTLDEIRELKKMLVDSQRKSDELADEMKSGWESMKSELKETVEKSIEENAVANGQLTAHGMEKVMEQYEDRIIGRVDDTFSGLIARMDAIGDTHRGGDGSDSGGSINRDGGVQDAQNRFRSYQYGGVAYATPQNFTLPKKTSLRAAWDFWINGNKGHGELSDEDTFILKPIRPFCLWTSKNTPRSIWKDFNTGWRKVFEYFMEAPGNEDLHGLIEQDGGDFGMDVKEVYFCNGLNYVHANVEYILQKHRNKYSQWSVTTWSTYLQRNKIEKHGTDNDKLRLEARPKNPQSRPHRRKRTRQASNTITANGLGARRRLGQ